MNDTDKLLKEYLKGNQNIDEVLSSSTKKEEVIQEEVVIQNNPPEPVKEVVKEPEVKIEPVPIKEVEKVIIEKEVVPHESIALILSEMSCFKSDLDMIKEAIVEILNKTLNSDKQFTEKINSMNSQQRKKIILNRDDSGKIISAETVDIKEGE